ncbi:MAG: DUF1223 domain-containing protein [Aestuariivirga sp.]
MNGTCAINRRNVLALGVGAAALAAGSPVRAGSGFALVELFTSQGCSSCPPADAYMEELRHEKGVVALSYNVDYWDYLGWRDTLAASEHSQRQYDYAKARGDMDVYTPQAIVNGGNHYIGADRKKIAPAIVSAQTDSASWTSVTISESGSEIVVGIAAGKAPPEATVWFTAIAPSVKVKIDRGENSGKEIVYSNVVRKLLPIGMWHGADTKLSFKKDSVLTKDSKACVAIVQEGKAGRVLGMGRWGEIGV